LSQLPTTFNLPAEKGQKILLPAFFRSCVFQIKRCAWHKAGSLNAGKSLKTGTGGEVTRSEYDQRTGVKHLRVQSLKAVRFCATLKALGLNILRAAVVKIAKMVPDQALCAV
jgi:hypothetical protein